MSIETELVARADPITEPVRVLVCGARDYTDIDKIFRVLDALQSKLTQPIVLIQGAARGADSMAAAWAIHNNLPEENHLEFPADWKRFPKRAGPMRNIQMLEEGKPNLVLAFGKGKGGTDHMVRIAVAAGVQVVEFDR